MHKTKSFFLGTGMAYSCDRHLSFYRLIWFLVSEMVSTEMSLSESSLIQRVRSQRQYFVQQFHDEDLSRLVVAARILQWMLGWSFPLFPWLYHSSFIGHDFTSSMRKDPSCSTLYIFFGRWLVIGEGLWRHFRTNIAEFCVVVMYIFLSSASVSWLLNAMAWEISLCWRQLLSVIWT